MLLTLFEERPRFAKVKDEATDSVSEKAEFTSDGQVISETINHGVTKISFRKWLKRSPDVVKFDS
jgi:hypothetical protein